MKPTTVEEETPTSSITLASDILKRATDVVYTGIDTGGIELHATHLDQEEDDWEPSLVSPEALSTANDLLEMHLKTTLEQLTPEAPTVLDVDARDKHLTHQLGVVKAMMLFELQMCSLVSMHRLMRRLQNESESLSVTTFACNI